ncbi:unnamed protein product [Caenorhabditis bovis]|uniref:Protein kinase domain-containing protein n=1 Tax=Caenorhabditis bovis TaxID=2654633 RepID=A0A8S1EJT9_9PELO|nr:unnamed protein product [Caenorhabditis bovis]
MFSLHFDDGEIDTLSSNENLISDDVELVSNRIENGGHTENPELLSLKGSSEEDEDDEDQSAFSNDENETATVEWTDSIIASVLRNPELYPRMRYFKQLADSKDITCDGYFPGLSLCWKHFKIGDQFDVENEHLVITDRLGDGSFGTVYKVHNVANDTYLAAKMFRIFDFENFASEYTKLKALNVYAQRNSVATIVKVLGCFEIEKHWFISMELLPQSYTIIREKWNQLDVNIIRRLLFQLISGIVFFSSRPFYLVHADLKPENLMLRGTDWNNFQVVIVDFGMSKRSGKFRDDNVQTMGYCAPEVLFHEKIGRPIDMFSFGIVALETYCGGNVFAGMTDPDCLVFMEHILGKFEYFRKRTIDQSFVRLLDEKAEQIPPSMTLRDIFKIYVPEDEAAREAEELLLDLIEKSLKASPAQRLTAKDAYQHEFFAPLKH